MMAKEGPEFQRVVPLPRHLGEDAVHTISANAEERAALAARFALLALDRLEAEVRLARLPGGLVRLSATLGAEAAQACIVSEEPVPARIEDSFSLLYGAVDEAREVVLDGAAETVEPLAGSSIDIGEAVAQQLSLVLDPFPLAEDVADPQPAPVAEDSGAESPFAALKHWRRPTEPRE
jgi:hypothetical protein